MSKVLTVRDLGKSFRRYDHEWKRFLNWFGMPFAPVEESWVLQHISFSLDRGEAVGIVGQNGAGKSTLLKLITGTLRPTAGKVSISGRVSAILELGMGFNPELTARENIVHSGALLGYSPEQIADFLPQIEEFAEVGDYFNQPLRVFSSGMQMRVAFSLATALRPDVLIVDEALSVGDAYFQHKSFARIKQFREQGTSLLLVSHDRNAIQNLCDRALLLEGGLVIKDGPPEEVFDYYNAIIAEKENSTVEVKKLDGGKVQTRSGTGEARVEEIGLYNSKGELAEVVGVGEQVELRVKVRVFQDIETLVLGYSIKDRLGQVMYGTNTWHTEQVINRPRAGDEFLVIVAFSADFGVGSYSVQAALVDQDTHLTANYDWQDLALMFNVVNFDKVYFEGCAWSEPDIAIKGETI